MNIPTTSFSLVSPSRVLDGKCTICQSEFEKNDRALAEEGRVTHVFHQVCLENWTDRQRRNGYLAECPLCMNGREIVNVGDLSLLNKATEVSKTTHMLGIACFAYCIYAAVTPSDQPSVTGFVLFVVAMMGATAYKIALLQDGD